MRMIKTINIIEIISGLNLFAKITNTNDRILRDNLFNALSSLMK